MSDFTGLEAALNAPAVSLRVQRQFSINPKSWADLKQKGVVNSEQSYGETYKALIAHYRSKSDAATIKAQATAELQQAKEKGSSEQKNRYSLLTLAKMEQSIKLEKAREREVLVKTQILEGSVISLAEGEELFLGLLSEVAMILTAMAQEDPRTQESCDKGFKILSELGDTLQEQVRQDTAHCTEMRVREPADLQALATESEVSNGC